MGRGCVLVCFGGCPCPSYNIHCHKEYDTGNNTRQPLSETISTIPPARAVPRVLTVPVVSQGARTLVDARMRQPAAIRCRRLRIGCGSDIAPRCLRNGAVRHPAIRLHAQSSGCARPVAALRCPPVSPASLWQAAAQARRGRSGRVRLAEKSARFRPGSPGTLPPPPPQRGQGGERATCVRPPVPGGAPTGMVTGLAAAGPSAAGGGFAGGVGLESLDRGGRPRVDGGVPRRDTRETVLTTYRTRQPVVVSDPPAVSVKSVDPPTGASSRNSGRSEEGRTE